ncbi:hypothetical protein ACFLTA_04585 [Bacteroidota bacterium]
MDSSNFQSISFVTVYSSESKGTISDDLGFFRFQIEDENFCDSIYLSCVGYWDKALSLQEIKLNSLDTIYMHQHLIELDAVEVSTKFRRAPRSGQIIKKAISAIPNIYPDYPVLYNGYFREYTKQGNSYINLLESIVELEDQGISSDDDFSSGLLFKRLSPQFKIDQALIRPYDNVNKFIPYSTAPTTSGNELVLLRAHDPVRNYNKPALYFIDCLETHFIRNHDFSAPKLTYLNQRPYYQISFRNKDYNALTVTKIRTLGEIFIDGLNYGIKKISYQGYAESALERKKLFDLNLEYQWTEGLYHLHYLSFNNLFSTRNFCITRVEFDVDAVLISFNQPYDPEAALNKDNYNVLWKGREMRIKKIELEKEVDRVRLVVLNGKSIQEEKLNHDLSRNRLKSRTGNNYDFISDNLDIEIQGLNGLNGYPLMPFELNDYYQYRELFVRDFNSQNTTITRNLVDKQKPVFETSIFGETATDTSWLNTPLIEESTESKFIEVNHKLIRSGLENMYLRDGKSSTDLVYIHTDREVYAPEDTLWFKAYIRDRGDLRISGRSQTFYVNLVDGNGTSVNQGKFFIQGSDVSGQLKLDHQLPEGLYYLTGYSSWMMNFSPDAIFSKQILVKKDVRDNYHLVASYNKSSFFPGDTIKIFVHCYDEFDREVEEVKFSYRILSDKEILMRGRANTTGSGIDPLILILPDQMTELPEIRLDAIFKGKLLDTLYTLPVNFDLWVDFYPEGGHLINGVTSRIAFKSQNSRGLPIETEGEIIDQNGTSLHKVNTDHDGMGLFTITPETGQGLSLKLNQPAGMHKIFPFPEAVDSGWQLIAETRGEFLNLSVKRKNTVSDTALITIIIRGYVQYHKQIQVRNRESLNIPTEDLSPGIAVVTLFDHRMLPMAERLVFIKPQDEINVIQKTIRKHYIPRDEISLDIDLFTDRSIDLSGSYSLSVIDDQLCLEDFIDEPDIRTSFLLSPEIKGRINNPSYYMQTDNKTVQQHLDLLLMTQGWRDYEYQENNSLAENLPDPVNRDIISGQIVQQQIHRNDEPVQGTLSIYYMAESKKIPISTDGRFSFFPQYYPLYSNSLFLSAVDDRGRDNVSIVIDSSLFERDLADYLRSYTTFRNDNTIVPVLTYENITDKFSLGLENHKWIEEVKILGRQEKEIEYFESTFVSARTPGKLEMETSLDPYEILINMGLPVSEEEGGSIVKYNGFPWDDDGNPAAITWNVNDMVEGYSYVKYLNPEDIASLFVVYFPETMNLAMPNPTGKVPKVIVSIHTKPRSEQEYDPGRLNTLYTRRFTVSKKFYTPVYETEEEKNSTIPDLRKTIHWEPDLKINEEGTATVKFYNGDRYTRIKCILEGITDEGIPVYSEYFYNVSLDRE